MSVMEKLMSMMGLNEEIEEVDVVEEREEDIPDRNDLRRRGSRSQLIPFTTNRESWKVVLTEPTEFDDCQQIVEHLRNRRSVIINLENIENTLARRIIDFVGGATYAIEGTIQKAGSGIFICAPSNTEISGDLLSYSQTKDRDVVSFINRIAEEAADKGRI